MQYTIQHNASNATPRHAMPCNAMVALDGQETTRVKDTKLEHLESFFKLAKFDITRKYTSLIGLITFL